MRLVISTTLLSDVLLRVDVTAAGGGVGGGPSAAARGAVDAVLRSAVLFAVGAVCGARVLFVVGSSAKTQP